MEHETLTVNGRGPAGWLRALAVLGLVAVWVSGPVLGPHVEEWLSGQQVLWLEPRQAAGSAWMLTLVACFVTQWRLAQLRRRRRVRARLDRSGFHFDRLAEPALPVLGAWSAVQGYSIARAKEVVLELEGARPAWIPRVSIPTEDEATRVRVVEFLDQRGVARLA